MRTLAIAGMTAMLVGGCALESSESAPESREAQEALTSFSKSFSFHKHYVGQSRFVVAEHGLVTVAAHASWDRPGACKLPNFDIELVKTGFLGSAGALTFPATGRTASHSWSNLGAGTYYLVFDSTNDEPSCELAGAVTVTIRP